MLGFEYNFGIHLIAFVLFVCSAVLIVFEAGRLNADEYK